MALSESVSISVSLFLNTLAVSTYHFVTEQVQEVLSQRKLPMWKSSIKPCTDLAARNLQCSESAQCVEHLFYTCRCITQAHTKERWCTELCVLVPLPTGQSSREHLGLPCSGAAPRALALRAPAQSSCRMCPPRRHSAPLHLAGRNSPVLSWRRRGSCPHAGVVSMGALACSLSKLVEPAEACMYTRQYRLRR